nr:RHS repeat domain-containing protein [Pirellula staleyi]
MPSPSMGYDANGNSEKIGYTTGDNNQLTSDGTYNYTYDAEANRLTRTSIASGDVTRYVWDHRNRLLAVIQEDGVENFLSETTHTYAHQNRWISRTVDAVGDGPGGSETTVFVHESQQIVLEFDGSAASDLSHRYLWGPSIDQF